MLIPKNNATSWTSRVSVVRIAIRLIYVMQVTVREIFVMN